MSKSHSLRLVAVSLILSYAVSGAEIGTQNFLRTGLAAPSGKGAKLPSNVSSRGAAMLPIRGNYQFTQTVTGESGESAQELSGFSLNVTENSRKYSNCAILCAVILTAGFAGGYIIASNKGTETQEGQSPRLSNFVLFVNAVAITLGLMIWINISAEIPADSDNSHLSHSHQSGRNAGHSHVKGKQQPLSGAEGDCQAD